MWEAFRNFKYAIGDKAWICYNAKPVKCEIIGKKPKLMGIKIYHVSVKGRSLTLYESGIYATKEDLCTNHIKDCEEGIRKLEKELAAATAEKEKWTSYLSKKKNKKTKK